MTRAAPFLRSRHTRPYVRATRAIRAAAALALFAMVPALAFALDGCSTTNDAPCGSEPDVAVCGRLAFECGTVTVCYACGVAKRVDCGACGETQTCGGGGTPHKCWPPLDAGASEAGATVDDASTTPEASTSADASGGASDASSDASGDASSPSDASGAADASPGGDAAGSLVDASIADAASSVTMVLCPDDAVPPETDATSE